MIFRTGDMWSDLGAQDLVFVTTNSTITRNGELVMRTGAARQARDKHLPFPRIMGARIEQIYGNHEIYGILFSRYFGIGGFQIKTDWKMNSDLSIIEIATQNWYLLQRRNQRTIFA